MDKSQSEEKNTNPVHLQSSELGNREYWSAIYSSDLETRQEIPNHTGTTWFSDADAEGKTVRYLSSLLNSSRPNPLSKGKTSFLDLGTGNGSMLIALRKAGWSGRMVGLDYVGESVKLADTIWKGIMNGGWKNDSSDDDNDEEEIVFPSTECIEFETLDIISYANSDVSLPDFLPENGFDVVLDKGTFDAVSLSEDIDSSTGKRVVEVYATAAKRFLKKPDGRMVITSCNWTEVELERWFCRNLNSPPDEGQLKVLDKVPYRTFKFGGKEGSVVVGMVFGWA